MDVLEYCELNCFVGTFEKPYLEKSRYLILGAYLIIGTIP